MREILFRGQTRRYGEKVRLNGEKIKSNWVYGGIFPQNGDGDFAIIYQQEPTIEKYPVYADTVGQYTGMKDKNGKKIFEGDILKIKSHDYNYEYITQVYYSCHTLCVDIYGQDYDSTAIGFADDIWDEECCEIEVIGNIYDNPELLGDEENDSNDT